MKNKKNKFGFTLIELMIAIAIIGLLTAVVVPEFADLIKKAKEAGTKGNLGTLRAAVAIYFGDNEGMFPQQNKLLEGDVYGDNQYESSWENGATVPDMRDGWFIPVMVPKYIDDIPTAKIGQPWIGDWGWNKEGTSVVGTYQSTHPNVSDQLTKRQDSTYLWEVWLYDASAGVVWVNANMVAGAGGGPMFDTRGKPITSW